MSHSTGKKAFRSPSFVRALRQVVRFHATWLTAFAGLLNNITTAQPEPAPQPRHLTRSVLCKRRRIRHVTQWMELGLTKSRWPRRSHVIILMTHLQKPHRCLKQHQVSSENLNEAQEKIKGVHGLRRRKEKERVKVLVGKTASLLEKAKISFSFTFQLPLICTVSPIFSMVLLIIIQLIRCLLTHAQKLHSIMWGRAQTHC